MNQPKTSHWASLAASLGAAPAENQNEEPSSKAPVSEEKQEFVEPIEENQAKAAEAQSADILEPAAEVAPEPEEPAAEETIIAPPTKRHWAGLAQSLGLPVERLFGKIEPAAAPAAPKPPAPKPAPKPPTPAPIAKQPEPVAKPPEPVAKKSEPAPSAIEKVMQEKAPPSRAESTARTMFDERNDSPETEKRAASLFIQIDSTTKKPSESTVDTPRNLLPGDEIFFDTGDYDLIDDIPDEPVATNYDRDDHEDDDDAPREVFARRRSPKVETSTEEEAAEDSSEESTDESGSPRPRRRRRRRGRRRDPRTETTSAEEGAEEVAETEVSAELEPTAKKSADSDEDSTESGGAPRRRRRRRRSRKADEGEARKTPEVATKRERVLTDVDFPEDDDEDDDEHTDASLDDVYDDADDEEDDEDQDLRRHRNIPSWLDAVTAIVELNIERHKTAPQHVDRRSGGGGGGRRRRGGGRRPTAN